MHWLFIFLMVSGGGGDDDDSRAYFLNVDNQ